MADEPGYAKPLPEPTPESSPFWDAAKRHELRFQECGDCGLIQFYPPRVMCRRCGSEALTWIRSNGKGVVYSSSSVYRAPSPAFKSDAPYNVSLVELDEGIRLITNVIDIDPDEVNIGLRVEVTFDDVTETVTLPKFRPASADATD